LIRASEGKRGVRNAIGSFLVAALPMIVKSLAVIGTIALLLVAGGIVLHDIHYIEELLHSLPSLLAELITGLVVGIIALAIFKGIKHLFFKKSDSNESAH
jgi:hypothetical protein